MIIKMLHLYYDLMNLYGDNGNMRIFERHIADQGFDVVVDRKTVVDEINFSEYKFIYIGSGTERNQELILEDLKKYKDCLKKYVENNGVILATGNSFEVFGKSIGDIEALGVFDFEVRREEKRIIDECVYTSKYFEGEIIGDQNRPGSIYHNLSPLFDVVYGVGENKNSDKEGVKYKNFYGTHLLGPILARNPQVTKKLVEIVCKSNNAKFKCSYKEYVYEENSHKKILDDMRKYYLQKK